MYKAIQDMFPDAAFTMFTGDIVDHGLYNTSQPYNENLSACYTQVRGCQLTFQSTKPTRT